MIKSYLSELNIIFETHKISKAYLFGSVLNKKFTDDSDIDFIIEFQKNVSPIEKATLWWSLHDSLRDLFHREIDLLTESSLKNPYFIKELNETKELIYGE